MKVLMVGDFKTSSGPGIANKNLKTGLETFKEFSFLDIKNKIFRLIFLFFKIPNYDIIFYCSPSYGNVIGMYYGKILRKKTVYLIHGLQSYEESLNGSSDSNLKKHKKFENIMFRLSNHIFCVSKSFYLFLKENFKEYNSKISYIFNSIKFDVNNFSDVKTNKNEFQIISVGGGMRRKNNLIVAKAIHDLRIKYGYPIKFIVIGKKYSDYEELSKFSFVDYYEYLENSEIINLMRNSSLYIQNSLFETFGLSILEGLFSGCSILISKNVGMIDIITKPLNDFIIYNNFDTNEIGSKIKNILFSSNNQYITSTINYSLLDPIKNASKIYMVLKDLLNGNKKC